MSDLIRSWVEAANERDASFPLNNLPFGVFSIGDQPRCATAIGDHVLDLAVLQSAGLLADCGFDEPALNMFMSLGQQAWGDVRRSQPPSAHGSSPGPRSIPSDAPHPTVTRNSFPIFAIPDP